MRYLNFRAIALLMALSFSILLISYDAEGYEDGLNSPVVEKIDEGCSYVSFSWSLPNGTDVSNLSGYRIYRGSKVENLSAIDLLAPSRTWYNDTDVVNGNILDYVVAALYGEDLVERRSEQFRAVPGGPPGAPVLRSLIDMRGGVRLEWGFNSIDGGFSEERSIVQRASGNGSFEFIGTVPGPDLDFIDRSALQYELYRYRIIVTNERGPSPPSNELSIDLVEYLTVPTEPLNLTLVNDTGYIQLSWDPPLDDGGRPVLKYILKRSEEGGPFEVIYVTSGDDERAIDVNLTSGVSYAYMVIATNEIGESDPSQPLIVRYTYSQPHGTDMGNVTDDTNDGVENGFATRNAIIAGGIIGGFLIMIAILVYLKMTGDVDSEEMIYEVPRILVDETPIREDP